MAAQISQQYTLGDFTLEPEARVLSRGGQPVHLARRPFQVLLFLVENRERVVGRRELLDLFWEGCDVYDETLTKCVGAIRRALQDKSEQLIETRYAEGYRYIGPLEERLVNNTPSLAANKPKRIGQTVCEAQADDSPLAEKPCGQVLLSPPRRYPRAVVGALALTVLLVAVLGLLAFRTRQANTATEAVPPVVRTLAVLPLRNLTGDAGNEYLSDGLTDSLINELARVNELKVISRASVFTFKNRETDPRIVGRQLGVAYLLEGSINRSNERIRINLHLVNTADGSIVWTGDSFDRALTDIFTMQDELSCSVAENLRAVLCGARGHKRYTENVAAYQAYLQGRYYWNKRTGAGIRKSIEYYQQAIALDANYALAYAGLADSYVQGVWHVPFVPEEVLPQAKAAALQAVALDDLLAEAHTALAGVYAMEWNWGATGRELQRAIELNPNYARAYHAQAFHLMVTGHKDEAVAAIERARSLDPLNLVVNTDIANIFFGVRRVDEALRQWEKTLELDPNFSLVYRQRAEAYIFKGDEAAAAADYLKEMELNGEAPAKIAACRQAYAAHGLKGIWRKQLDELLAQRARGGYASPIGLAYMYMRLGQKDEALAQLEQVYRTRSVTILLAVSPAFDSLRSDPRFQDIMRRTGLAD